MTRPDSPLDPWVTQASVWKCVRLLAQGHPCPAPLAVELHLGTACNLACPECISRPILDTARFEPERALSLAQELVDLGVRSVVLSGGGEPLLHPSAGSVLRVLAEGGVTTSLVTNGTLLERHFDAVVQHPRRVWVSIDAATADTHALFRPCRGGGPHQTFPHLIEGVRRLAARRHGNVTFSFLLLSRETLHGVVSNAGEMAAAARLAREIGCSTFEVNVAFDRGLRMVPSLRAVSDVVLEEVEAVRATAQRGFHVHVSPMVELVAGGKMEERWASRAYDRCLAAEVRALVGPRGVYLCPRHQDLDDARYGDPVTTPLGEIWASVGHREALRRVRPVVVCDGPCMSMDLNGKLERAVAHVRNGCPDPVLRKDDDLFL
jgi:MoaA/NifB/PqqE/SkfB family radical SAM enzyme